MAAHSPEIAVITRTYSGQEGNRVHAGTRFAIAKKNGDLVVISLARYNQLRDNKLARPLGEEDAAAIPRARYQAGPTATQGGEGSVQLGRDVRQAARRRNRGGQPETPTAPKSIPRLTGSPTGEGKSPSLSPEAQASGKSTSTSRGTRGRTASASSPSTTPTR